MKKNKTEATIIISAVHEWIVTYLPLQRSSSIHTQKAYTDALALYVNFLNLRKVFHAKRCRQTALASHLYMNGCFG